MKEISKNHSKAILFNSLSLFILGGINLVNRFIINVPDWLAYVFIFFAIISAGIGVLYLFDKMKSSFYQWLTPLFVGILIMGAVWFIADPETFQYFPQAGGPSVKLYTALTVIVATYFMYVVDIIAIRYFTGQKNRIKIGMEYVIMLFFILLSVTLIYTFITYFINYNVFKIPEWIRVCGLIVPIGFIYYLSIRNGKVTEEYNRQTLQLEQTRSNQLETELKYLRAQYHPHFLFNALNTIYFHIDEQNVDAKNTVELLSQLLRYQLYNMEEKVAVSEEINFIKTYIQFQQLRMTKRLVITTHFDNALDKQKIYPLIYQPFLENAFKYVGGEYRINLEMKLMNDRISFHLENSLPEQFQDTKKSPSGIGIENIKRRLALLYPDRHQLNIKQGEKSFIVELFLLCDV